MESLFAISPQGYSNEYPAPPRVHWLTLFGISVFIGIILQWKLNGPFGQSISVLISSGWWIYLSLWLRKLTPSSTSLYWCLAFTIVALTPPAKDSGAGMLWVAGAFVVREEIQKHYTERESIGLQLSAVWTFLFSFFYFQYHLYEIAEYKQRNSVEISGNAADNSTPGIGSID